MSDGATPKYPTEQSVSVRVTDERQGDTTSTPEAIGGLDDEPRLYPTRILRLAAMIQSLLVEMRHVTLDPGASTLLTDIYHRSVEVLSDALPSDLDQELGHLLPLLGPHQLSQAELRLVHAQLYGWLAGLLQGLHVASVTQHLPSYSQHAGVEASGNAPEEVRSGVYL